MASEKRMGFLKTVGVVLLVYGYLQGLLFSVTLRLVFYKDVSWMPATIFSIKKNKKCHVRLEQVPHVAVEIILVSIMALFGYFCGAGSIGSCYKKATDIFGRGLPNFEYAMMGIHQKYCWLMFIPWLITFSRNWVENIVALVQEFDKEILYESSNSYVYIVLLLAVAFVQLLAFSEVMDLAMQGCRTLEYINEQNRLWEPRKRVLSGDNLNTVFGLL